jgi:hypothetical protein
MTTPIRRVCRGIADLPSLPAIRQLVDDDHHLVLRLDPPLDGADFDERMVIDRLASQLPDYTVFDSGGAVTIKKVIAEAVVLAQADAILAAAEQFRRTATDLMGQLSRKVGIPLESFTGLEYRPLLSRDWFRSRWKGRVDSDWRYGFHGHQCGFKNRSTGQVVEVEMGFRGEFGVLDPFFFSRFVSTTPGLEKVAALFRDSYHDPLRALVVLERRGRLMRITDRTTGRRGLVAPQPCS